MITSRKSSEARGLTDASIGSALGVVSVAIGVTELAATKPLQKLMGLENNQTAGILRVLGVREVLHGLDLLTHRNPTPGVWARVAGDMLDGALIAAAATKSKRLGGLAVVAALVLPVVLADIGAAPVVTARR